MDTDITLYGNEALAPKPFADLQNQIVKHSPEILVGVGIVGVLTSTVLACRATLKAPAVLEEAKEKFADIESATELVGDYTDQDRKQDLVVASLQTAVAFGKLYIVPAVLMGGSIYAICRGHGITMKRNDGLTAAVTALTMGFKTYRDRVAERVGEEAEEDIYYGRKTETIEEETTDTKGKIKTVKTKVTTLDPNGHSPYAKFFDEASSEWQNSPEMNITFLRCQQNYANDKLRINKVLFLNEVYDMLGLPRTSAGQVVGWAITDDGDNFVDFGLYDVNNPQARRFVNGDEMSILLDFNVNGVVHDLL